MAASPQARRLPRGVWALGLVSLFMDASSELILSLLPLLLTSVLGASMATVGLIEGTAEAAASVTKVFSGAISDYFGKRKPLAIIGYGLAALTKPIFPLAGSVGWVFGARFLDRIGKGVRGAPRDALVAEITPPEQRGAAYGLRQSLDSVGAFLGPLLAVLLMALLANDIRAVLWVAVVPAFLAVLVLALGVREPDRAAARGAARSPVTPAHVRRLPLRYWLVVLLAAVSTLARFSEAFLLLRARDVGVALGLVPVVMIVMNVVYSGTAYPVGVAADRMSRKTLAALGLALLVAADLVLASAHSAGAVFLGAGLWGLHLGFTQGLFSQLVAESAGDEVRGTAFGLYNFAVGGALLLASVLAGALWTAFGAPATFLTGAAFAALSMLGLLAYRGRAAAAPPARS
jgi:MFS family permease